mmetsp:Transcript_910/g.1453  ORF Transcript_910/g.1453 Transcript_910/m.1453 type:complete len:209 (-) Transcript_910:532-1158(-)|eukprot:CAMPEP_0203767392 /NCGR_PEP_ID=MMETSP0099_2-20121227/973_1 /ASSEMBLY_ACC=CAM_ASM_000209 /TAXON_ID=96639 /ORGANISM=" , Strain NY0313808BC1" /LENGTH=208 /DNA_ID=CAMNT_0050663899 /DNA_START=128 /DNA_END=754 /DNA_ORIENTATION=+
MNETYDHLFKILLVGDEAVGKSSILLRFTDNTFNETQASTIGVDFKVKMLEQSGQRIKVTIWDTAGQERFRTLTSSYYRGAQGIVLTYDVTRRETFEHMNQWLEEVKQYTPGAGKDVILVLVGNKVDLDEKRQVSRKEGEAWARQRGMLFIETSAKTKLGIQQVFQELIQKILDSPALLHNTVSTGARRDSGRADLTQAADDGEQGCC